MANEVNEVLAGVTDAPRASAGLLRSIELPVAIRFGSARLSLRELSTLRTGAAVTLDTALTDPAEIVVGGNVIARGEPLIVGGKYAIRITQIASEDERLTTAPINGAPAGAEE